MKAFVQVFSFDVVSKGALGLIGIALIRLMPAPEYAKYTFALSVLAFALQSVAGTFNRVYILMPRHAGQPDVDSLALLAIQFLVLGALALLGLPLAWRIGYLYVTVVAVVAAACLYEFARSTYQKELNFKTFAAMDLQRAALFGALVLLMSVAFGEATSAAAIIGAQGSAYLLICWRESGGWLKPAALPDRAALHAVARKLLADGHQLLVAYFFLIGILTQVDVFMLAALGDDTMVASYGSAYRYYAILALALGSAHAVLLPMITQASSRRDLDELLKKHFWLLIRFATAVFVAAWASGWFIPLIDSGKYPDAVPVFRILSVSIVVSFAFSPHVNLILRNGQYRFLVILVACALVVALVANYLLIPVHGAVGAALATLASAALVNVTIYVRSKAQLQQIPG